MSMNSPVKLIYLSKISKVLWKILFPKTVSGDSIAIRVEYKKRKGMLKRRNVTLNLLGRRRPVKLTHNV